MHINIQNILQVQISLKITKMLWQQNNILRCNSPKNLGSYIITIMIYVNCRHLQITFYIRIAKESPNTLTFCFCRLHNFVFDVFVFINLLNIYFQTLFLYVSFMHNCLNRNFILIFLWSTLYDIIVFVCELFIFVNHILYINFKWVTMCYVFVSSSISFYSFCFYYI